MQQLFVYSVMVKNIKDEIYHQIYIHDKAVGIYIYICVDLQKALNTIDILLLSGFTPISEVSVYVRLVKAHLVSLLGNKIKLIFLNIIMCYNRQTAPNT